MEPIGMYQLLTLNGALAGLQLVAITWRINRELVMEDRCERTWLTLADLLVAVSFLGVVASMFVLLVVQSVVLSITMSGVAFLLFAASPFVLVGHYNLYGSWGRPKESQRKSEEGQGKPKEGRPQCTKQEMLALVLSLVIVAAGSAMMVGDAILRSALR